MAWVLLRAHDGSKIGDVPVHDIESALALFGRLESVSSTLEACSDGEGEFLLQSLPPDGTPHLELRRAASI
jgi:hypothetical protein